MPLVVPGPPPAPARWYEPRTYVGTVALFVAAYVILQPSLAVLGTRLSGWLVGPASPRLSDLPWGHFLGLLALLGVLAGSLWWAAGRIAHRVVRWLTRGAARYLALATFVSPKDALADAPGRWLGTVLATALVMALLFFWLERWEPAEGTPAAI